MSLRGRNRGTGRAQRLLMERYTDTNNTIPTLGGFMNASFSRTSFSCGFLLRLPAASPTELSCSSDYDRPTLVGILDGETSADPVDGDPAHARFIE